jgi:protein arginine kinase activator
MKCELCKKKEAATAVKQQVEGEERELFVCPDCAKRAAASGPLVTSLVEMLLGAALDVQMPEFDTVICPGCGLPRAEFRKRGRAGCATCYETFAREIAPMLRDMQGSDQHVGKVPAREHLRRAREELESELKKAIRAQRYEDAAVLRDRIRKLLEGGTIPPGGAHGAA